MKAVIMQPYFFPYLGYFHLIHACDHFVFYDDVNFINRGWINRNNILLNRQPHLVSVPLKEASQNKKIADISVNFEDSKSISKILKSIDHAYSKAPFYQSVIPIIQNALSGDFKTISDVNIYAIKEICAYINLHRNFYRSSESYSSSSGLDKADRLISISKGLDCSIYINSPNGKDLYSKTYFAKNDIDLFFISPRLASYKQFDNPFVSHLSIIDMLMFLPPEEITDRLKDYDLE